MPTPNVPLADAPLPDPRQSDRPLAVLPGLLPSAVWRLLRPLVRLMMQSGLTFPVLADSLRHLFVEIAVTDILTDPGTRTDSRISLLTGVHRKEIRRLREMPADPLEAPGIVTLASQIIARWIGCASFASEQGRPKPLHRIGNGEAEPSFADLVASVTSDVRPRVVANSVQDGQFVVVLGACEAGQRRVTGVAPDTLSSSPAPILVRR